MIDGHITLEENIVLNFSSNVIEFLKALININTQDSANKINIVVLFMPLPNSICKGNLSNKLTSEKALNL